MLVDHIKLYMSLFVVRPSVCQLLTVKFVTIQYNKLYFLRRIHTIVNISSFELFTDDNCWCRMSFMMCCRNTFHMA